MDSAAKAPPCPITELPDELLVAVASHLDIQRGPLMDRGAEARRRQANTATVLDIHALALTCRKLNAIATPLLYRCIVSSQTPSRVVKRLLRTLVAQPELCRHIRYIESPGCVVDSPSVRLREEKSPDRLTKREMSEYIDRLSCLKWWGDSIDASLSDSFSRDLHELASRHGLFGRLHAAAVCLMTVAQNLSQAIISCVSFYASMFACKRYYSSNRLQTLWIYTPGSNPHYLRRYDAGPRPSGNPIVTLLGLEYEDSFRRSKASIVMDTVSLDGEDIVEGTLQHLLMPFAALKRFECRWRNLSTLREHVRLPSPPAGIDLPAYRSVLLTLSDSLETLTIDTTDATCQVDMDEDIPAFGSFRQFTALKHLNVSGLVLFGDCHGQDYPRLSAILPDSLETLSIKTEWDRDIAVVLVTLYKDLSTTPSRLRILDCSCGPAPRMVAEMLMAAFRTTGIHLVLSIDETGETSLGY
ncbi:hypothetical protein ACJQWK_09195 [Exserohilum turcicum]|uniref:Leucine-rich repeat domain-containing protein n=1 Tax=Exserohilum turcicum (strain 28A) TaxID=671987 RepID=R0IWT8_EXST2|nr:uncharacterized protein SETTUDRAFT_37738 [Exserohilum turcica Et28A]EOA89215.1 hypothetical protein SETTUDRAFT_37738 [Exserohilum turcica Et28A]